MTPPQPPRTSSERRVIEVERSTDGVVVTFDDGRTAVYDANWLHQQMAHAKLVMDSDSADDLPINR
jgi:predicted NAD/FAD-binding protein